MIKLFHGKESYLSFLNAKSYALALKQSSNAEYVSIEAASKTSENLILLLSSDSIFNTPKVYLFKRLLQNKEKESVVEFLITQTTISQNNHYIFWEDQKVPSNTKYFKHFQKVEAVDESNILNKPSFQKWLKAQLDNNKIRYDIEVIQILSSRVNYNPERALNEIEKFIIEGVEILTKELVQEKTQDTLEKEIWDLTKHINEQNQEEIFRTYNNLKSQLLDPNFIISMLARNFRLLTLVKELTERKVSSREICSILRIPPFTLPELQSGSKEITWEKLKFLYEKLSSLDYEIKRGNIEPQTGLTLLLSKI